MTYVMSDINGRYDLLIHMVDMIQLGDDDTLCILGNVVDRGPEPIRCLQYIMQHDNIVLLVGNGRLINTIAQIINYGSATTNIQDTVYKYGGKIAIAQLELLDRDTLVTMLEYLQSRCECVRIDVDDKIYVMIYNTIDCYDVVCDGDIIISGYTSTRGVSNAVEIACNRHNYALVKQALQTQIDRGYHDRIMYLPQRIYIDCGVIAGGNLACLRLDDMTEYYISAAKRRRKNHN